MRLLGRARLALATGMALLIPALLAVSPTLATLEEPAAICLLSPQGPIAAVRSIRASSMGPEPEQLMTALLAGPTPDEAARGITSAIPPGTRLYSLATEPEATVTVHLQMPLEGLQALDHSSFEAIVHQIGKTLESMTWRGLRIETRDPESGAFVPLSSFLPEIKVEGKEATPVAAMAASPGEPRAGQPAASGQGQPSGALSGKTVYVSAGHGWAWTGSYWSTQRAADPDPPYEGPIVEDHNNAEVVNQYLLQYLWNAGAMVWPMRERDMNGAEAIVNNDDVVGYSEAGGWANGDSPGYDLDSGGTYRYAYAATGGASATATWSTTLPATAEYAVYVWYRPGGNRAPDARFTVHHAGGETAVTVNQQHHGITWHYIGTYAFRSGETASVVLDNHSSCGSCVVVADAVRFGGGTFDALSGIYTTATYPPNEPWYEVAAFYYSQRMGVDPFDYDDFNDVIARPIYARWEHTGTGDDAVYVSWHTNGWTGATRGTESYAHNGEGLPRTDGSLALRDAIHAELVGDIRAGWDAGWADRGTRLANYGELRLLWDEDDASARIPGALIEIAFHDNPSDADALKDPEFELLAARAVYQGIAKYFLGAGAPLLPEPPTHLAVTNLSGGQVRISWQPSPTDGAGLVGHAATGYRVYVSNDGLGWSNGTAVAGTDHTVSGLSAGQLLYVRVSATNAGGESFPTDVLAARVGADPQILLVNGFDRLGGDMAVIENDPLLGLNARLYLDQMNSFDYSIEHSQALPYAFDGASNEAVRDATVLLTAYNVVDWILGEEDAADQTFDPTERIRVAAFLDAGGSLFVSGTEIGQHLDGQGADPSFYNETLLAGFVADDAGTYQAEAAPGSVFAGLPGFAFDAPGTYDADTPDILAQSNGSRAALNYNGGLGGTAGVEYANGCSRLVHFGLPFETIAPSARGDVMSRALVLLGFCTAVGSPADGSAHNAMPTCEGTSRSLDLPISRVQLRLQRTADGWYWTGSSWAADEAWFDASGTTSWNCSLPSLSEGDYLLLAQAEATDGSDDVWPPQSLFTYDTVSPSATILITPTGGITISGLPAAVLEWDPAGPDGGSPISYLVEVDGEYYSASAATYGIYVRENGIHTWGVQAVDAAGNRSEWVTDTFRIERQHTFLPIVGRSASW